MKLIFSTALSAAITAGATAASAHDKPPLAFGVNAVSDFWKLAEAGVNKAQGELPDYDCCSAIPARAPQRFRTR